MEAERTANMETALTPGPVGGAANDAGSLFRSSVAAWCIAHGLAGVDIPKIELPSNEAIPMSVALETDEPVDDINVELSGGGRALIQAKRSLNASEKRNSAFVSAISQWIKAVRDPKFDAQNDRLIIAAQTLSQPVLDMANALRRLRAQRTGALNKAERTSIALLCRLISDLTGVEKAALLGAGVILRLDLESDGLSDAGVAEGLLRGLVVKPDDSRTAWRELKLVAWELAATREGRTIDGWLDVLRDSGCDIVSDIDGSAAAKREAMRDAVARYRSAIVDSASTIDRRVIGVPIKPIPASLLARVKVEAVINQDRKLQTNKHLTPETALLRRGRALVLGLPGSGKSTLLRTTAAYWAARPHWPLPVLFNLRDAIENLDKHSPLDTLTEIATRQVDLADRAQVREAIRDAAINGQLALFLDSLDETRGDRFRVVAWIDKLIGQLSDNTEVYVTSRDTAYSDAATLGFSELRLLSPEHTDPLLRRVIEEFAVMQVDVTEEKRSEWINARFDWVQAVLSKNPMLAETPILPILLASLAGQSSDLSEIPQERAKILSEILDRVTRSWEINKRGTDFTLGSLNPRESQDALIEAFERMAYGLLKEERVTNATAQQWLAAIFKQNWGMPSGRAMTAANDAIHFWDEAGILVSGGSQEEIKARVNLMAELGAARYLAKLPKESEQSTLIDKLMTDETSHEVIVLSAGLSTAISDQFVNAAVAQSGSGILRLAGRSVIEGARPTHRVMSVLIQSLIDLMGSSSELRWDVAKCLVTLPLNSEHLGSIVEALDEHLPSQFATLAKALASMGSEDPPLNLISQALRSGPPKLRELNRPSRPSDSNKAGDISEFLVDDGFSRLVEFAAGELLKRYPEISTDLFIGADQSSVGSAQKAFAALRAQGFLNLVKDYDQKQGQTQDFFINLLGTFKTEWVTLVTDVAALSDPIELTIKQCRRFDELAALFDSLMFSEAGSRDVAVALISRSDVQSMIEIYATLIGQNKGVLSAQAKLILEIQSDESTNFGVALILDSNSNDAPAPERWDLLEDKKSIEQFLCEMVGHSSEWISVLAANALDHDPNRSDVVSKLELAIPGLAPRNRDLAARIIASLDTTPIRAKMWASDEDPLLRRAAASVTVHLFNRGEGMNREDIITLLNDQDAGVIERALSGLDSSVIEGSLLTIIERIKKTPGNDWMCDQCGNSNIGVIGGCKECSIVGPDASKAASSLLADGGY